MHNLVRISFALICLFLCIALTIKGEQGVFRFVEYYSDNWVFAAVALRLLVAGLAVCGGLFLLHGNRKIFRHLPLILVLPLLDVLYFVFGHDRFGSLFTISESIVEGALLSLVLFVLIIGAYLPGYSSGRNIPVKRWRFVLVLLIGVGVAFLKPVYIDDWEAPEHSDQIDKEKITALLSEHNISYANDQPLLTAYFTTSCPYCALSAQKMGISLRNGELPRTVIVFPSTQERAVAFLKENGIQEIPFILVDDETFLKYAGNSFPSIYFGFEGKKFHFSGNSFNFRALNMIQSSDG